MVAPKLRAQVETLYPINQCPLFEVEVDIARSLIFCSGHHHGLPLTQKCKIFGANLCFLIRQP
jgi:hypothetical protein